MKPTRAVAVALSVVLAAGCVGGGGGDDGASDEVAPEQQTMVVIGAGESDGSRLDDEHRELWSRRVYQRLPRHWALVGYAVSGATVAEAADLQVTAAREVDPALVLVWLVSADADAATPLPDYRADLSGITTAFPQAEVVLLTQWRTRDAERDRPYSDVVQEVAAATRATLVDLGDVDIADDDAEGEVARRVLDSLRARPR